MLPPFALARPRKLEDALQAISAARIPLAGGLEILLAMRSGELRPDALVDLKHIPELYGIHLDKNELVVGALETHGNIATHPLVKKHLPLLARIEHEVGTSRIRAQGTLGGILCRAEPKSDMPGVVVAFNTRMVLRSLGGERTIKAENFFTGPHRTIRNAEEILTEIRFPLPKPGDRSAYQHYKWLERRPTVGVGITVSGVNGSTRVGIGAVGEVPQSWEFDSLDQVEPAEIAAQVEPTVDLPTGSAEYKRHITEVFVRRVKKELEQGSTDG